MNLRFAPEQLRFRISEQEFANLMAHGLLEHSIVLGDNSSLNYSLRTDTTATGHEGGMLQLASRIEDGVMRCELTLFAKGIDQLKSGSTGKDGIRESIAFANGDLLTVGVEIDLHSKKGADPS